MQVFCQSQSRLNYCQDPQWYTANLNHLVTFLIPYLPVYSTTVLCKLIALDLSLLPKPGREFVLGIVAPSEGAIQWVKQHAQYFPSTGKEIYHTSRDILNFSLGVANISFGFCLYCLLKVKKSFWLYLFFRLKC